MFKEILNTVTYIVIQLESRGAHGHNLIEVEFYSYQGEVLQSELQSKSGLIKS